MNKYFTAKELKVGDIYKVNSTDWKVVSIDRIRKTNESRITAASLTKDFQFSVTLQSDEEYFYVINR